jgi:hypothetical protein
MSLADDIFPTTGSEQFVQTEWADGWFAGAAGFGYAAEHLTEHRKEFGALIDHTGLAVFFLQRHRAEMVLKGLLDFAKQEIPRGHALLDIWDKCKKVLEPRDAAGWKEFADDHHELVKALDRVDQSSFTFRYPVDNEGVKNTRPAFIDLDVLNEHVDSLEHGAGGYIDYLTENGL